MQTVTAKCIMDAYDSSAGRPYLRGGVYEIERNSELAKLKTAPGARGKYVFEFDRNAGPDDKPHDYSCKKDGCGAMFKSLAALGSHTRSAHKDDEVDGGEKPEDGADGEEGGISAADRTCYVCDPPKELKTVHGLRLHNMKSHPEQVKVETVEGGISAADRTCYVCDPPKELKTVHGLRLHNMKSHPEQVKVETVEAETALA